MFGVFDDRAPLLALRCAMAPLTAAFAAQAAGRIARPGSAGDLRKHSHGENGRRLAGRAGSLWVDEPPFRTDTRRSQGGLATDTNSGLCWTMSFSGSRRSPGSQQVMLVSQRRSLLLQEVPTFRFTPVPSIVGESRPPSRLSHDGLITASTEPAPREDRCDPTSIIDT